MKIALRYNRSEKSQQVAHHFRTLCAQNGLTLVEQEPDIVISIGGDGTLLSAFHEFKYQLNTVRFIAIHTGHLGFYTDWRDYELDQLVESIVTRDARSVSYPLLEVTLCHEDGTSSTQLALNEMILKKVAGTMVCDVIIGDTLFETFRGDGLCVSTPTGSTGVNKSLGGAVVHPRVQAMQLTEMASINNRIYRTLSSPIILPTDEVLELRLVRPVSRDVVLLVDNLFGNQMQSSVKSVQVRIAQEKIHFAKYRHTHFWDRVEDAFIGEIKKEK